MTAEMNLLLEEGVTRSQELTDAADEALRDVDQMAQAAAELAQHWRRSRARRASACVTWRRTWSRPKAQIGTARTARPSGHGGRERRRPGR